MKKHLLFVFGLFFIFAMGCNIIGNNKTDGNKNVAANSIEQNTVMVTNYPLYFFTKQIVGDKLTVQNLLPPGVEPHSFEPAPKDIIKLEKAKLLIYNGAGLEDWIVKIGQTLDNKELEIIDASKGVELIQNKEKDDHPGEFDPHIWLDPVNSKKMVSNILDALVAAYHQSQEVFRENAQELIKQLDNLDQDYREQLTDIKKKVFVVNHAAFGYLARRYGLQQLAVMGVNPHTEPTPQKIVELVKLVKEHDLKYIYTETLVSSKVAEVLAQEAGIGTKVLNPLGNLTDEDIKAGKDYFSIMYENLAMLKEGLE
ncbi:MAG: zinc ABC transporter substrate-binding protein [Clostridia bacterium]|nr:zinc ABC transporter substrate-binding protein [Clostridia bacterium]